MVDTEKILKTVANAVSMITVPTGALDLGRDPLSPWGWFLFLVGLAVQFAKYYYERK